MTTQNETALVPLPEIWLSPDCGGCDRTWCSTAQDVCDECDAQPVRYVLAATWQPISTAPFVSAKRYWLGHPDKVPIIAWRIYPDGPWLSEGLLVESYAPTHWMSLPPPPDRVDLPANFVGWLAQDYARLRTELEEQARLNGMGAERELKLRAENERLRFGNLATTMNEAIEGITEIGRLRAELTQAREALKPFALYYDVNDLDERCPDDALEVPVRDLRRARAVLAKLNDRDLPTADDVRGIDR